MVNSLFVNACILITFLYLGSQLFANQKIFSESNYKTKISIGVLYGLTGCLLMLNGINMSNNMIMDFRIIALIISALFCGPVSAFITVLFIISFRFGYFGISAASITATINLIIIFSISSILSLFKLDFKKKFIYMAIANILFSIIWTFVLVKDAALIIKILSNYILSSIVVSIIIYLVLVYIHKTNEMVLKFKKEAEKDFLTGLFNVREFDKLLNTYSETAYKKNEDLSLLMIDIDFFKKVNDSYGHKSGDMVLQQLSDILTDSSRTFDIVSRKGGEEFTVILLNCNHEQAMEIAERIRGNVENHLFIIKNNKYIKITVSIGISSYPSLTKNLNDLIHEADEALYCAKRNGRNQVK